MRSPYLVAFLNPFNLSMLGIALFALLFSAWWLFPLGILFWLIMVYNVASDPLLNMNYDMQQREPLAPRFQTHFDHLETPHFDICIKIIFKKWLNRPFLGCFED